MTPIQRRLIAATIAVVSGPIHALGLGDIQMNSALNQQLDAVIPIELGRGESLSSVGVQMAAESEFLKAGIDFADVLFSIDIDLQGLSGTQKPAIKLSSQDLIREPFLSFLLDVNWAGGRMVREYTVLLDPPALKPYLEQQAAALQPTVARVVEPEIVSASSAQPIVQTPALAPIAPVSEVIISEPVSDPVMIADPVPAAPTYETSLAPGESIVSLSDLPAGDVVPLISTDPILRGQPVSVAANNVAIEDSPEVVTPVELVTKATGKRVRVSRRQTLWSIARKHRPDPRNITMDQMLVALFKANPESFDGNMNRVRTGSLLRIPNREEILQLTPAQAKRMVVQQKKAHRQTLGQVAAKPEPAKAQPKVTAPKKPVAETKPKEISEATSEPAAEQAPQAETAPATAPENNGQTKSANTGLAALAALANKDKVAKDDTSVMPAKPVAEVVAEPAPAAETTDSGAQSSETPEASDESAESAEAAPTEAGEDKPVSALEALQNLSKPKQQADDGAKMAPSRGANASELDGVGISGYGQKGAADAMKALDGGAPRAMDAESAEKIGAVMDATADDNADSSQSLAGLADAVQDFADANAVESSAVEGMEQADQEAGPYHEDQPARLEPAQSSPTEAQSSSNLGLWATIAGAGVALIGLIVLLMRRRGKKKAPPPAPVGSNDAEEALPSVEDEAQAALEDTIVDELSMDLDETEVDLPGDVIEELEAESDKTAIMDSTQIQEAMDAGADAASGDAETPESEAVDEDVLDIDADTVALELDENDPVSEADFHLAYGLYDEAALLLSQALETQPERHDIRVKLMEAHFASGKSPEFLEQAEILREKVGDQDANWQKVAIMGQQLCPDSSMFALSEEAVADADVDIDFGLGDEAEETPEPDLDFTLDAGETAISEPESAPESAPALEIGSADESAPAQEEPAVDETSLEATIADSEISLEDVVAEASETADDIPGDAGVSDELTAAEDLSEETLVMDSPVDTSDVAASAEDAAPEIEEPVSLEAETLDVEPVAESDDADKTESTEEAGLEFDLGDFDLSSLDSPSESSENPLDSAEESTGEISLDDLEISSESTEDDNGLSIDGEASADDVSLDDLAAGLEEAAESTPAEPAEKTEADIEAELALAGEAADSAAAIGVEDSLDVSDDSTDFGELNLDDLGLDDELISDSDDDQPIGDGDEVNTKLDLARAYVDMNEPDMARGMLEEVAEQGTDEQKAEAKELLSRI